MNDESVLSNVCETLKPKRLHVCGNNAMGMLLALFSLIVKLLSKKDEGKALLEKALRVGIWDNATKKHMEKGSRVSMKDYGLGWIN